MMANGDPKGRIFLSCPHTNNRLFLLTTVFIYIFIYLFIYFIISFHAEVPENAKMQFHMMPLLDVLGKIAWAR